MFKNPEIFIKAVQTAKNHIERAEEGARLLAEGRSLSEMTIEPSGLSFEETRERRCDYLDYIKSMDRDQLQKHLAMIEHQIDVALSRPVQGTSELYWQRIVILDLLEEV